MIKLTNGQASAFNSPAMGALFSDTERHFPIEDAFRLSDLIEQINQHQKAYGETFKSIVEKHQGKISPEGRVDYPSAANQERAGEEISKLNEVEIEVPGNPLEITDEWPKLTLAEATVLKPVIKKDH